MKFEDTVVIEANPDRKNIYYKCKVRPSSGEDKLNEVLLLYAEKLKEKKIEMPLAIVYGTLATCADAFLFFSQVLTLYLKTAYLVSFMPNSQNMRKSAFSMK